MVTWEDAEEIEAARKRSMAARKFIAPTTPRAQLYAGDGLGYGQTHAYALAAGAFCDEVNPTYARIRPTDAPHTRGGAPRLRSDSSAIPGSLEVILILA